jgi:hypothetical protein
MVVQEEDILAEEDIPEEVPEEVLLPDNLMILFILLKKIQRLI